jgi:hypothetical protein
MQFSANDRVFDPDTREPIRTVRLAGRGTVPTGPDSMILRRSRKSDSNFSTIEQRERA